MDQAEHWIRRLRGQTEDSFEMRTVEEPKTRAKNALFKLLELSLPPTPENFTRFFYEKDLPSMEDLFRKLLDLTLCLSETSDQPHLARDLNAIRNLLDSDQVALQTHPQIETLLERMLLSRNEIRKVPRAPLPEPPLPTVLSHDPSRESSTSRKRPLFNHRLTEPEDLPESRKNPSDTGGRAETRPEGIASTLANLSREAAKLQSQMNHIQNLVQTMENRMGTLQKHNRKVTREANIDPLTGVLNRRGLQHRLSFLRDPVLSLLIFDLDDFKTVNDKFGHNAGDEVLRKIAHGVRTLVRKVDLFSRFGGDEFIIVMPALEIAQARFVAERIRSYIACMPVLVGTGSLTITASFGLTGTDMHGAQKMDDLLELADSALYQAKNQGKNQICVTNPIA
jgi:two-component system cell cycle response regulator